MSGKITACLGLGGNLGDAAATVRAGIAALQAHPAIDVSAVSSLYRTAPLGPPGQPDYVNAAVVLTTAMGPEPLLDVCQQIENAHGRTREGERWGPRTLDVDVLLYGQLRIETPRLSVPHPQMHLRGFVLVPLAEIAPSLMVPERGHVEALLAAICADDVQRLGDARE